MSAQKAIQHHCCWYIEGCVAGLSQRRNPWYSGAI